FIIMNVDNDPSAVKVLNALATSALNDLYGDNKYMRAMRLMSGFFASLPNMKLHQRPETFEIHLPSKWPWFYLRRQQLLLFLQDPTHLATKWRNRLLSSTAKLMMGQQLISIQHLQDIIDSDAYSKLDHGLVRTDINPKDSHKSPQT
ncbi:unnamed protein product, partial [Didymodactylos carnosus]